MVSFHFLSFILYKHSHKGRISTQSTQTSHCHKPTKTQSPPPHTAAPPSNSPIPLRSIMAPSSTTTDGPVLNLINKRLRALRKKLNRITSMEESLSQGKSLNSEQQEVLRSKSSVLVLIDELEKLRQPLSSALTEELELATQTKNDARETETQAENSEPRPSGENSDVVEDILNLLYFGSLFEVKTQNDFTSTMLTRTHERGCCLTYDYVTDDATDLLGEKDLDAISGLYGLLISRPADSSFSHKNALRRCIEHAKLWVSKAQQPIDPNVDVTCRVF